MRRALRSLMGFAGWLLYRSEALEVLRKFRVLPTTVLPGLPSLRDCLCNRWKDLLVYAAWFTQDQFGSGRRGVPLVAGLIASSLSKYGPDDACGFVGECDRCDVLVASQYHLIQKTALFDLLRFQ